MEPSACKLLFLFFNYFAWQFVASAGSEQQSPFTLLAQIFPLPGIKQIILFTKPAEEEKINTQKKLINSAGFLPGGKTIVEKKHRTCLSLLGKLRRSLRERF